MKYRNNKKDKSKKKKRINKLEYYQYLRTPQWKLFRQLALDTLGHECGKCGNKNELQVHHKHYKNIFQENIKDVMILCASCHRMTHKKQLWTNGKESKYMRHPNTKQNTVTYYPDRKINPTTP